MHPSFHHVPVDGAHGVWHHHLHGGDDCVQGELGPRRISADDGGRGAVTEQPLPHEPVEVGLIRGAKESGGALARHHQHARVVVILRDVLSHAQERRAPPAPRLVHHHAPQLGREPEHVRHHEVQPRHVHHACRAHDDVRDRRELASPFGNRVQARLHRQLGDPLHHHLMAIAHARVHVRSQRRILLQQLLPRHQMPFPNLRLVT